MLAIFAILPKKLRRILLVVVAVLLVFSYLRGGIGSSTQLAPVATQEPEYSLPGQTASLFDTSSLFEQEDLFGSGSSYSGGTPSGSSESSAIGGLMQALPGFGQSSSPAVTEARRT